MIAAEGQPLVAGSQSAKRLVVAARVQNWCQPLRRSRDNIFLAPQGGWERELKLALLPEVVNCPLKYAIILVSSHTSAFRIFDGDLLQDMQMVAGWLGIDHNTLFNISHRFMEKGIKYTYVARVGWIANLRSLGVSQGYCQDASPQAGPSKENCRSGRAGIYPGSVHRQFKRLTVRKVETCMINCLSDLIQSMLRIL
ncbi:hypothetical protein I7I51_02154 [Histoplasma capsulatum]|uniref:Uncharacterized protein n=1 Tax=Ajellomyces capsulatus TaxID=5037 RepID=A0A8A1ME46_AJECA|nr:hypothetical protein I7I51_02154 [Histoplasma capsulatum]